MCKPFTGIDQGFLAYDGGFLNACEYPLENSLCWKLSIPSFQNFDYVVMSVSVFFCL